MKKYLHNTFYAAQYIAKEEKADGLAFASVIMQAGSKILNDIPSRANILSPSASTIVTRANSSETLKKCFSVGLLAIDFISSTNFSVLKFPLL